jgi:dTMP kinase
MTLQSKFIVLEGIDGSGKTTQLKRLSKWFLPQGQFFLTQEPNDPILRDYIKQGSHSPALELWLFSTARVAHLENIIVPALNQGRIVLCDRFTDSTIAYQHYGRGLKRSYVNQVNYLATQGLMPDVTIVLDIDIDTATERKKARGNQEDNFDNESYDFFSRVRRGYQEIVMQNPTTHVLIDGNLSTDQVTDQIIKAIQNKL